MSIDSVIPIADACLCGHQCDVAGLCAELSALRLFQAIGAGEVSLAISTEILLEYEEIATRQGGPTFAGKMLRMLSLVEQVHRTIVWANPSFRFHVITSDLDDNKFADCAITTQADYVITEDGHLNQLIGSGHRPQPIAPGDFIARYLPIV